MGVYLVIDPGLKNCGVVLVEVEGVGPEGRVQATILWSRVMNLSGKVNPDKDKALAMFKDMYRAVYGTLGKMGKILDKVLVEFQPPLATRANPALVRWNSWVEAYTVGFFQEKDWPLNVKVPVVYIHSGPLKRHFDITTGSHYQNKSLALGKARSFLADPETLETDHEADCVLMGIYEFLRNP